MTPRTAAPHGSPDTIGGMLDKAMALLDAFAPDGGPYRLAELARRAGLAKSTAHRLTGELLRLGLLESTPAGYRLGSRLSVLGALVPHRPDLRETARPYLHDLHAATGETAQLGVRAGRHVLILDRIPAAAPTPAPVPGPASSAPPPVPALAFDVRLPLTCTALGKALLAFSAPELTEALLAAPLPQLTPHSPTDPHRLRADLAQIRASGLAQAEQESTPGTACVAAPLLDAHGTPVAALSLSAPLTRYRTARLAPAVRTAALTLSRHLHPNS